MSERGPAHACTVRRHAARPHRLRGRHRASWAAELSPLLSGTQSRYTAVVGTAVAGASAVAIASAAGMPAGDPAPADSEAAADVAAIAAQSAAPEQHRSQASGPVDAEPSSQVQRSASQETSRVSPVAVQEAQVTWAPMLDRIDITSLFGQRWGRNHNGVDFAAAVGTPIYAAYPGTVTFAGWQNGYGNVVIIDHGEGVETRYAHNSELTVAEGQWVEAGEQISEAGNTGFSLGPHLHFEVHVDGEPVEPLGYLESAGLELR
ncbi:hypothetical protein GCM10027447_36710 [Glycomyces halotolerans]